MRILFPVFLLLISTFSFGQMLNDSPFNASISNPKYKKQKAPLFFKPNKQTRAFPQTTPSQLKHPQLNHSA